MRVFAANDVLINKICGCWWSWSTSSSSSNRAAKRRRVVWGLQLCEWIEKLLCDVGMNQTVDATSTRAIEFDTIVIKKPAFVLFFMQL